jgi:hypothetical protein
MEERLERILNRLPADTVDALGIPADIEPFFCHQCKTPLAEGAPGPYCSPACWQAHVDDRERGCFVCYVGREWHDDAVQAARWEADKDLPRFEHTAWSAFPSRVRPDQPRTFDHAFVPWPTYHPRIRAQAS